MVVPHQYSMSLTFIEQPKYPFVICSEYEMLNPVEGSLGVVWVGKHGGVSW